MFFHDLRDRLHRHHAARHHHHHAGFGFGGRHGRGDDLDHSVFGRGRKLGAADLQLLLLALLAERPSHGYELIKALEERSNGYYAPSPGMVYPALTYLEELGRTHVEVDGTKKRYTVSEAGLDHLEQNRAAVDALLEQLAWIGRRMDGLRRAMAPAADGDAFDAPGGGRDSGIPEVRQARRNLKSALIAAAGASEAEQRRVAQILERAAAEIRGDAPKA